jgi:hypothetical protein
LPECEHLGEAVDERAVEAVRGVHGENRIIGLWTPSRWAVFWLGL